VNIEFQMRTEEMHLVAESGVAAHWLYKASTPNGANTERLGTKWLQSLLDIQNETRDAAEFWDHVKVDLFPDAVYVFTPKSQIMALPRGATVVDFAYAIHSNVGDRTTAARINNEQVPLRTELKNGDVVEIITAPVSPPQPGMAGVRAHRPRTVQDSPLPQDLAHAESEGAGRKAADPGPACRRAWSLPPMDDETHHPCGKSCCASRATAPAAELLTDLGLGKRIASIVAKRLMVLLSEHGEKPDALLMTRERYTPRNRVPRAP
jgi:guanosine-3',5'-bis(diphosphate) 3'-pyrophosphohydrolase